MRLRANIARSCGVDLGRRFRIRNRQFRRFPSLEGGRPRPPMCVRPRGLGFAVRAGRLVDCNAVVLARGCPVALGLRKHVSSALHITNPI